MCYIIYELINKINLVNQKLISLLETILSKALEQALYGHVPKLFLHTGRVWLCMTTQNLC